MTQSFDEWFEKNGELYREPTSDERYLFEAGAQSKQAEIDFINNLILSLASQYSTKAAEFNIKDDQELATLCNEVSQKLDELIKRNNQ